METNRPLILISNDDGYAAKGIRELIEFVRPFGRLVVMAPAAPRSGMACALSLETPVYYERVREEEGVEVYKCSGTPVDCVKLACHAVLERQPDLLISGINHGDNSSVNAHYSGTMGVAIEGALKGIPSVAFSVCSHEADIDFSYTAPHIRTIVAEVLRHGLPPLTCLNVNFPVGCVPKGIKVCEQSKGDWVNEWDGLTQCGNKHYYWMSGWFEDSDLLNEANDHWALSHGYTAITPTTVDLTHRGLLNELQTWFSE